MVINDPLFDNKDKSQDGLNGVAPPPIAAYDVDDDDETAAADGPTNKLMELRRYPRVRFRGGGAIVPRPDHNRVGK